jgi:hypothetical protein
MRLRIEEKGGDGQREWHSLPYEQCFWQMRIRRSIEACLMPGRADSYPLSLTAFPAYDSLTFWVVTDGGS